MLLAFVLCAAIVFTDARGDRLRGGAQRGDRGRGRARHGRLHASEAAAIFPHLGLWIRSTVLTAIIGAFVVLTLNMMLTKLKRALEDALDAEAVRAEADKKSETARAALARRTRSTSRIPGTISCTRASALRLRPCPTPNLDCPSR